MGARMGTDLPALLHELSKLVPGHRYQLRLQQASPLPAAPDSYRSAVTPGRRLKVVQLTDRLGTHGGAEHLTIEIAERLDPERFESMLCATRFSPGEQEKETV